MGSGARAEGESPKAGWEARGTHNLGVLLSDDDDGTSPGSLKEAGGGDVEKGPAGQRSEGRDMLEGSRWEAPLPDNPKCTDQGPPPQAGAVQGEMPPLVCLSGLASTASSRPRSASLPSVMNSVSPSVSHPLPLPPPPLSLASCSGLGCLPQWSPGLWCCAPELWP